MSCQTATFRAASVHLTAASGSSRLEAFGSCVGSSLDSANCLSSSALNSLGELKTTCQLWSNAAVSTEQQVQPKRKHQYINQVIRTRIAQPETHNAKQRQIQLVWVLTNAPVALFLVMPLTWRWPRLFSTLRFWPLPMVQVSNHQSRN